MFGWIEHVFSRGVSWLDSAAKAFVHALIRGVYSFLHDIFHQQWDAWNAFWNGVMSLYHGAYDLSLNIFRRFRHIYQAIIPWLSHYILWVYHTVVHLAYVLYRDAWKGILYYYHVLLTALNDLKNWVIRDVWDPLFKSLTLAWHWLTHEGAVMWHYFTHLPELAEILFWHLVASLERHAWDAGKFLGKFFLSLMVHNIRQFATLIENVIDAVL